MEVTFSSKALDDLLYWKQKHKNKILERIKLLVESIQSDPFFTGLEPKPLKYNFAGMWSRRINREHRIIYEVVGGEIIIHALREHY